MAICGSSALPFETPEGDLFTAEELYGAIGREVSVFYGRSKQNGRPEHQHEQAQMVLTYEKAAAEISWFDGNGKRRKELLTENSFCLIPPGVAHSCRWPRNAEIIILYLDGVSFREHFEKRSSEVVIADFKLLSRLDGLLWPLAEELRRLSTKTSTNSSFISALGTVLANRTLERFFENTLSAQEEPNAMAPGLLAKISDFIEANLKELLNTRVLAKHVGLSAEHFARLFKRTTGMPPIQFIAKSRVQKALELLRTGNYRVADAAYEVGFYDQSHLDRHCRKFFGFPPKVVLKKALKAS